MFLFQNFPSDLRQDLVAPGDRLGRTRLQVDQHDGARVRDGQAVEEDRKDGSIGR